MPASFRSTPAAVKTFWAIAVSWCGENLGTVTFFSSSEIVRRLPSSGIVKELFAERSHAGLSTLLCQLDLPPRMPTLSGDRGRPPSAQTWQFPSHSERWRKRLGCVLSIGWCISRRWRNLVKTVAFHPTERFKSATTRACEFWDYQCYAFCSSRGAFSSANARVVRRAAPCREWRRRRQPLSPTPTRPRPASRRSCPGIAPGCLWQGPD